MCYWLVGPLGEYHPSTITAGRVAIEGTARHGDRAIGHVYPATSIATRRTIVTGNGSAITRKAAIGKVDRNTPVVLAKPATVTACPIATESRGRDRITAATGCVYHHPPAFGGRSIIAERRSRNGDGALFAKTSCAITAGRILGEDTTGDRERGLIEQDTSSAGFISGETYAVIIIRRGCAAIRIPILNSEPI